MLHSGWCVPSSPLQRRCRCDIRCAETVEGEERKAGHDTASEQRRASDEQGHKGKPDPFSPRALGKMYLWGLSKQKRLSGQHLTPTPGPSLVDSTQRSHRLHRNQLHLVVNAPCIGPLGGDLAALGRRHSEESPLSPGGIRSNGRTVQNNDSVLFISSHNKPAHQ